MLGRANFYFSDTEPLFSDTMTRSPPAAEWSQPSLLCICNIVTVSEEAVSKAGLVLASAPILFHCPRCSVPQVLADIGSSQYWASYNSRLDLTPEELQDSKCTGFCLSSNPFLNPTGEKKVGSVNIFLDVCVHGVCLHNLCMFACVRAHMCMGAVGM